MIFNFFQGVYDVDGWTVDLSPVQLIELLARESIVPEHPDRKHAIAALSTAIYPEGTTRAKANAAGAEAIALDVDDGWNLDDAEEAVEALETPYAIYSTTKHTSEANRFRIVLFLNRVVDAVEYENLWLGLAKRFGATMDTKTRDISRLATMPRAWTGSPTEFRWRLDGQLLDVDAILKHYPVDPKPEPEVVKGGRVFDALREHRKALQRMMNANVDPATLTDLHSSPIIPAKTLNEALASKQGGRTFKLLCAVAASAIKQGFEIGVPELVEISRQFSTLAQRGKITDAEHKNDSANALRWAQKNVRDF